MLNTFIPSLLLQETKATTDNPIAMKGTAKRTLISSSSLSSSNLFSLLSPSKNPTTSRVFQGFKPLSTTTTNTSKIEEKNQRLQNPIKQIHNPLLEKLRMRHLKGVASKTTPQKPKVPLLDTTSFKKRGSEEEDKKLRKMQEMNEQAKVVSSFGELGLNEDVVRAVNEMGIGVPTEIQCVGIPAILEGKNVVLGSDTTESGATLAYMLPIFQLLRRDEASLGLAKPRHPRAVLLSPTMELSEQVFHVVKTISCHAPIRPAIANRGECLRSRNDSSDIPIDMVVGTPSSVLRGIKEGDMVYDDIKYLVLDDADTMFDSGLGPEICKFLGPLKDRASKSDGQGFQVALVISTITKMIGKHLSSLVERLEHDNSGKVAGVLLEMDQTEVFHLVASPDALKKKVTEAMMSLI